MGRLSLGIEGGKFCDRHGRQIFLRGINVAGDAKFPSTPDQPSHVSFGFFEGDTVKFHDRPFPLKDAHMHFSRLRRYGYNCIRYVFTWEAIEAAGPGIYDEEWIQHTIEVLRVAKQYDFYVFMDPHQDVWSRFTGGSGAPMWTLYACGLNPHAFAATDAALVQNTYPDPAKFPKMIWATNYYRLATATVFTLFFAGRDFAPKCIIDGVNIQDYLQDHFVAACRHLARRIHEAGDLENEVVFGWENLNEISKGMIGYRDISVVPKEQELKKGTCPTIWQAILTGSGRACEVDTWDMGNLGAYKVGTALIDPCGESAWLPAGYDESRYRYKRHAGWKLGECVWAQHGVWDPATDTLLRKEYFSKNPHTGETIDYPYFTNNYFMDFYRKFRDGVRAIHPDCLMMLQGPTLELPPMLKGSEDDDPNMIYSPHWYDGITLMTKKWNRVWNVDVLGVLRGRYLTPALAVRVGETAIRNCFRDQLAAIKEEGQCYLGNHPCMFSEFGIPFDMDDNYAYKTGDYSSQCSAMDANHYAMEGAVMDGYILWAYVAKNDHSRGDQWNGEDLSIISRDDRPLPVSSLPARQSTTNTHDTSDSSATTIIAAAPMTSTSSTTSTTDDRDADHAVTPSTLKSALAPPTISSVPDPSNPSASELSAHTTAYRAAEAFVRPAPEYVRGRIAQYGFDLAKGQFSMTIHASPRPSKQSAAETPAANGKSEGADEDDDELARATTVVLPDFHFPSDQCVVDISSGKWTISDEGVRGAAADAVAVPLQRLRWWHEDGTQRLVVTGLPAGRRGGADGRGGGYFDMLGAMVDGCGVM